MSAVSAAASKFIQPGSEFGEVAARGADRPDYRVSDPLGTISGFTDYSAQEMRVIAAWKSVLWETFQSFGFTRIDTPPVQYAQNLQKTGGLDKQIYGLSRLQDGSLTKMGLPFDRTVPMAIFLAKHANGMSFPYSRSDIDWSWRGEHAKAGRYRAFIQADVDTVAPELSPLADAQCIVTIIEGLKRLGVPKFNVYLNHVGIAKAFLAAEGIAPEKFNDALRAIDKLKPDNLEEVVLELTQNVPGLSTEIARKLLDKMSYRGPLSKFVYPGVPDEKAKEGLEHLKQIEELATQMGVDAGTLEFAPNLTRGLNYYTGVVFETFMPGKEHYGSIASGGRYDDLVGEFNPRVKLKGVGGSIGLTRLFDVMKAEGRVDLARQTTAQAYVGYRTPDEMPKALEVATALRQTGIYTELQLQKIGVKKQLDFVDKKGIPTAILVMNRDELVIKDMRIKKESEEKTPQVTFKTVAEAVTHLKQLLGANPAEREEGKEE